MFDDVFYNEYGFDIPMEHIPSGDELQQYAAKDREVVDTLINGLVQFTVNVVDKYARENDKVSPYKEDLTSEALLKLVEIINNKLGSKFTAGQFLGYIKRSIVSHLNDWLRECVPTITVPARTQQRNKNSMIGHKVAIREHHKQTSAGGLFSEIWFDDFMASLEETDQEIVRLRIAGLSQRSISEVVGLSQSAIMVRLDKIHDAYLGEEE